MIKLLRNHPWILVLAAIALFTTLTITFCMIASAHPPEILGTR